ncbi:MAG TPA: cob(I)yrinic acid a,c-diamide adenosyltransferase [Tepidisphaeraceae bacterium]|nr:cob(I)yrinic acid a,c-diamide adenosyltransferase [Tepidisphaeraceae bacterium]
MRIYTRTGDDGTTGLIGGTRKDKSDLQLDCYGTIDELNALLGLVRSGADPWLGDLLEPVQNELFVIGSHLALGENESPAKFKLPGITASMIDRMEVQIDSAEKDLPALRNFILPAGTETSARLHLARTVCRRAERLIVGYAKMRTIEPPLLAYLNRLSDWLFVYARLANHRAGVSDVLWKSE